MKPVKNVLGAMFAFILFLSDFICIEDCNISVCLLQEIAALEADLEAKDALMEKQSKLLQHWQGLLESQKNTHVEELERV